MTEQAPPTSSMTGDVSDHCEGDHGPAVFQQLKILPLTTSHQPESLIPYLGLHKHLVSNLLTPGDQSPPSEHTGTTKSSRLTAYEEPCNPTAQV